MAGSKDERYSEQETVARREAALKHMLSTPPKPHKEMKIGTAKPKTRQQRQKHT